MILYVDKSNQNEIEDRGVDVRYGMVWYDSYAGYIRAIRTYEVAYGIIKRKIINSKWFKEWSDQ